MNRAAIGVVWALAFVVIESVQFVFFGAVFQRMNSFLFGAIVFLIVVVVFVAWAASRRPDQLRLAFANPKKLLAVNVTATFAWLAFLGSVERIEPAVAYTIGAGVMPLTAWAAWRLGVPEGEPMRNRMEGLGNLLILAGIVFLAIITIAGLSGFALNGWRGGVLGVALAIADGVLFTWLLIHCQRLDRAGVGPGTVFGLRFMLYVVVAGSMAIVLPSSKPDLPWTEVAGIVAIGLILIVPPLYALQRAVALVSTLTIGALTALGPFVIFVLQMAEGRVDYSSLTLVGLGIYFVGAILAAAGAVRAATA